MNRIGNKWSEDEEQRMVKGLHEGRSLEDMAKDHQRTPKAMEMRRDVLLRKLSGKASLAELATMFSMRTNEVRDILAAPPPAPIESSSSNNNGTQKSLDAIVQRLDRLEVLVEKIYRRLKNPK